MAFENPKYAVYHVMTVSTVRIANLTMKEPIRTLIFTSRLPCHIII